MLGLPVSSDTSLNIPESSGYCDRVHDASAGRGVPALSREEGGPSRTAAAVASFPLRRHVIRWVRRGSGN